jgi:dienelactone hydrolase
MDPSKPLQDQTLVLPDGVSGRPIVIDSANPRHFEAIVQRQLGDAVRLHAALFVPQAAALARVPAVIVIPGSGGVLPPLLLHAQALVKAGIAALLVDPFGGRSVTDTIAEQRQIPFAASAYDVFAAMRRLRAENDIDTGRLGAMGYSRGGVAVLAAAQRVLAEASLGDQAPLRAVLAGWPWCGYQFADPDVGDTAVRIVAADSDDWASAVQSQAYHALLRLRSERASFRLFANAAHGFGYGVPIKRFAEAMVALNAPIVYFDGDGVPRDPWSGERRPGTTDAGIVQMLAPFLARGVTVGSRPGQMEAFIEDFVAHFVQHLKS